MAEKIGFQNGIKALENFLASQGMAKPGLDKIIRTLTILKDEHDASVSPTPPPPPPPPPQPGPKLAPQTYNKGGSGQDARYCTTGLSKNAQGQFVDGGGYRYDDGGRCLGGRSGNPVAGLKPADQMDGKEPCTPYNSMPPWPAGSYLV